MNDDSNESMQRIKDIMNLEKKIKNQRRKSSKIPSVIADKMKLANNRYMNDREEDALQILAEIVMQSPNFAKAYQLYARIYGDRHNRTQSKEDEIKQTQYLELANLSMNSNRDYSQVAHLWFEMKKYEPAALNFGKALKKDKFNIKLRSKRAECYERLGRYPEAIKEMEKNQIICHNLQINDKKDDITMKIAKLLIKNNQYEEAFTQLNQISGEYTIDYYHLVQQMLINREKNFVSFFQTKTPDLSSYSDLFRFFASKGWGRLQIQVLISALQLKKHDEFETLYEQLLQKSLDEENLSIIEELWDEVNKYDLKPADDFMDKYLKQLHNSPNSKHLYKKLVKRFVSNQIEEKDRNDVKTEEKKEMLDQFMEDIQNDSSEVANNDQLFYLGANQNQADELIYMSDEEQKPIRINAFDSKHSFKENKYQSKLQIQFKSQLESQEKVPSKQSLYEQVRLLEAVQTKEEASLQLAKIQHLLQNPLQNICKLRVLFLQIIEFEINFKTLRDRLLKVVTKESQKPTFKRMVKSENFLQTLESRDNPQLIQKKKSNRLDIKFLKKKKLKAAIQKSDSELSNIYTLSKIRSWPQFLQILMQVCEIYFENQFSEYLLEICLKLNVFLVKQFRMVPLQDTTSDFCLNGRDIYRKILVYGLWSSMRQKEYSSSIIYIRRLVKLDPKDLYLQSLFSIVFRQINDPQIMRTGFLKQIQETNNMMNLANMNLNKGNFVQAIELYDYLQQCHPNNSLILLLFSLIYIQLSTQRGCEERNENLQKGLFYLNEYFTLRKQEGYAFEVRYNLGRLYQHLGLNDKAIEIQNNLLDEVDMLLVKKNMKEDNQDVALDNGFHENQKDLPKEHQMQEIRFRCGYNLFQIYKQQNNIEKQEYYMMKYLTL